MIRKGADFSDKIMQHNRRKTPPKRGEVWGRRAQRVLWSPSLPQELRPRPVVPRARKIFLASLARQRLAGTEPGVLPRRPSSVAARSSRPSRRRHLFRPHPELGALAQTHCRERHPRAAPVSKEEG